MYLESKSCSDLTVWHIWLFEFPFNHIYPLPYYLTCVNINNSWEFPVHCKDI